MENFSYEEIKRTTWKVEVLDRLYGVGEDVRRAISVAGWSLTEGSACEVPAGEAPKVPKLAGQATPRLNEAQAVVETTYKYIHKTMETLAPLKWRQRCWDLLTGDMLMSAYTNLHAAESTRVLLLSSDQLAAIMPSIRQRAIAFLPESDPNRAALNAIPDPNAPAHQAVVARIPSEVARQLTAAKAGAHGQGAPPDPDPDPHPDPGAGPNAGADPGAGPNAGADPGAGPNADADPGAGPNAGADPGAGPKPNPDPAPDPTLAGPAATGLASGITKLTDMLGADQQIAAQVMGAACRAEDLQQLQVRHFRGVLLGASASLFAVAAVLWVVGSLHPTYFPLCWPVQGSHPPAMICPSGGSKPSMSSLPLVLGLGAIGAALAVVINVAGLKPAGVRFSLTVAQGLIKIGFGAITAVLGIIVLRTLTGLPGILATQPGLLTTAVVFGYSQQLFTKLIDRQANDLMNAASTKTPATEPAK